MIHLGDITKISGYEVPIVDCVIGGSPCQDLSVAGKRAGLDGERSGLFMEQLRIIKEMRDKDAKDGRTGELIRPRFMVWENVPGAFSSNKGEDFRVVLEETAKVIDKDAVIPLPDKGKWSNSGCIMGNGWSIAWRVFDAQFWGVPQRRRRIALVADFGGGCSPEILFVRKGLQGNSAESRKPRQGASEDAQGCVGADDSKGCGFDGYNASLTGRVSSTIGVNCGMSSGRNGVICYGISAYNSNAMMSDNPHSGFYEADTARTLDGNGGNPCCNQGGIAVVSKIYSLENHPSDGRLNIDHGGKVQTLTSRIGTGGGNVPMVMEAVGLDCYNQAVTGDKAKSLTSRATDSDHTPCILMDRSAYNQGINAKFDIGIDEDGIAFTHVAKGPGAVCYVVDQGGGKSGANVTENLASTLTCTHGGEPAVAYIDTSHADDVVRMDDVVAPLQARDYKGGKYVLQAEPHYIVRRLTPLECERLQGYPDGWTDIGDYTDTNGKKCKASDSARYKALGNSIALPSWKWVLKRLCSHYERDATMASLFDGIGGFPYIWEMLNGKGSCLWASEIEEFPMAVTRTRIG